ncbi:MAG: hypothetical protein K6A23_05995 [Butyrivibrio sp.]|nr:hypothetical protein [Butyrivibrio sp.]
MKKTIIKILKGLGITIVAIPVIIIALFIAIEVVGYAANHITTSKQTKELTAYIEKTIEDASISEVYSFTGNSTGTGNHVECLSRITFKSDMSEDDVDTIFKEKYKYYDLEGQEGSYVITVYGDAPFPDNIEGH